MNVATLGGNETNLEARLTYHAGLSLQVNLEESIYLTGELLYSLQGARNKEISEIINSYHYLNFPLMIRYYIYDNVGVSVGAQNGYLIAAKIKDGLGTRDVRNELRHYDIGVIAGLSYKLPAKISFGLYYYLGLINTREAASNAEIKFPNRVLSFYVAVPLFLSN